MDGVVDDELSAGADGLHLFDALAKAASDAGSHNDETGFHGVLLLFLRLLSGLFRRGGLHQLLFGAALVALFDGRLILFDGLLDGAVVDDLPVADIDTAGAELFGRVGAVGDEQQGDVVVSHELADLFQAFFPELFIAHGKGLIDDEDLRMDVRVDGKAQTGLHAAGIGADGLVDVLADVGELDDLGLQFADLLLREAQRGAPEVDVFPAGHFGLEAGGELQQRGDSAVDGDLPFRGETDAGDHFEDGGLAGAVAADERHGLAGHDLETHIVDGVLGFHLDPFREDTGQTLPVAGVQLISLGDVFEFNDRFHAIHLHQSTSGMSLRSRL